MRRILSASAAGLAVVVASLALAASTLAGGSVAVSSSVPWSFGVFVEQGATYDVVANGYVQTAKIPYYHIPGVSKSASGPAGQPDKPCLAAYESDVNGQCALEGANFGALIGMVTEPATGMAVADPFVIGAGQSFVAPADGVLMLAVNDLNLTYYDNNGQFTVGITAR